ncbi:hypothetical protein E1H13_02140 [Nodosilinea sp. P-1105]|nr:hypothetical protein [Nodosilinea sp. P-1105]
MDYNQDPLPPLSETDLAWIDSWLKAQGRRSP